MLLVIFIFSFSHFSPQIDDVISKAAHGLQDFLGSIWTFTGYLSPAVLQVNANRRQILMRRYDISLEKMHGCIINDEYSV